MTSLRFFFPFPLGHSDFFSTGFGSRKEGSFLERVQGGGVDPKAGVGVGSPVRLGVVPIVDKLPGDVRLPQV